jgi:hypothetical protein
MNSVGNLRSTQLTKMLKIFKSSCMQSLYIFEPREGIWIWFQGLSYFWNWKINFTPGAEPAQWSSSDSGHLNHPWSPPVSHPVQASHTTQRAAPSPPSRLVAGGRTDLLWPHMGPSSSSSIKAINPGDKNPPSFFRFSSHRSSSAPLLSSLIAG